MRDALYDRFFLDGTPAGEGIRALDTDLPGRRVGERDMSHHGRGHRGTPDDQLALDDLFGDVADEKFLKEVHTFRPLSGYETSSIAKAPYDDFGLEDTESAVGAEKAAAQREDSALPYSKARCIALVATVVGASFTAVSTERIECRPVPLAQATATGRRRRGRLESRPTPSSPRHTRD